MKQRILSLLVALLALTTGAWADDDYELTVHDSKAISNSSIPFYGSYMNNYTRNEMIYPAAELAVMSGADITSLTFYKTDDITESWGAASFKIYLMEVSNSTLSAYIGMTGATVVYEGSVDATGGERPVTINFTTPYRYNGGNLLVGVYQTVKGSASIAAFCGQLGFDASSGTSSGSYDSQDAASAPFSQQDFLPKTTFTYKPAPFDYELTVEASDHGSGQVKFFIDGKEVEGAYETDEGKTVTVKVTPDEGWVVDAFEVTAEVYRYWEGSRRAQAMVPMQRTVDLKYERTTLDGVAIYTFTMPASNVKVKGAYLKLSTLYFDPADRTNLMKVNVGSYGDVNVEDGKTVKIDKVEDILEGAEITLTANTGYKFRKVEVKKGDAAPAATLQSLTIAKGSTGLSEDKVLYYMPGDTYRQALARTKNQSTGGLGWGYWEDSSLTTLFFKEVTTKAWDVAIDGDSNFGSGKGTCTITLDTEINPTGHTFQFVTTQ